VSIHDPECEAAGLDPAVVARLAKLLDRAGKEAARLGLTVFGGSGSGSLRHGATGLIVAYIPHGHWDGGDGAEQTGEDGLRYGETL
jgi:hypothetical protein